MSFFKKKSVDADSLPKTITSAIGLELMLIPTGNFTMGGDWGAEQADETHGCFVIRDKMIW